MAAEVQKQSRNGKKPVVLLDGVSVSISGQTVKVKGPKGEIERTFRNEVQISQEGSDVLVRPREGMGQAGIMFQGTTRAIIGNMVEGAKNGYKKSLDFRGVGYRAEYSNNMLKMTVGLSHQPVLAIPENVSVSIEQIDMAGTKFPRVHLECISKEVVGRVAARIRSIRPPNPYGGKGVRYTGEKIREKAGKSGSK